MEVVNTQNEVVISSKSQLARFLFNLNPSTCVRKLELENLPLATLGVGFSVLSHSLEDLTLNNCIPSNCTTLYQLTSLTTLKVEKQPFTYALPEFMGTSLRHIQELIIANCYNVTDTGLIRYVTSLKRLQLSHLPVLQFVCRDIGNLTKLEELRLEHCASLQELPSSIVKLSSLHTIVLKKLGLTQVPIFSTRISSVRTFTIADCDFIMELPPGIISSSYIQNLTVRLRCIRAIHEDFGDMTTLEYMNIGPNRYVDALPMSIGQLTSLHTIRLNQLPALRVLPSTFGLLVGLRKLELVSIGIQKLPATFGLLSNLEDLHISSCEKLAELPKDIGKASSLKKLEILFLPEITQVPSTIGSLTHLEKLFINCCGKLYELPASMTLLPLRVLHLHNLNNLKFLPIVTYSLTVLEELSIKKCGNLDDIPSGLRACSFLSTLELLSLKSLVKFPDDITSLSNLKELKIQACNFESIPACIKCLQSLEVLIFHSSKFRDPSNTIIRMISHGLCSMKNLKFLDLTASDLCVGAWRESYGWAMHMKHVLALGRAVKAWPPPLLYLKEYKDNVDILDNNDDVGEHIPLCRQWRALGLPAAAQDWSTADILDFFRLQQEKIVAFTSGKNSRLGQRSYVCGIDDFVLCLIADHVLGSWTLYRESQIDII